jgi:nitrate reductase gamma subunit
MSIEGWTQWLRGPVFWAALAFLILGLGRHAAITAWAIIRTYRRAGDRAIPVRQILVATLKWLFPLDRLGNRILYGLSTLAFHISVILVPVFLAGHIALWQRGLGISWPAIPNRLATTLTIVALLSAVAIVIQRVMSRESRALSRFQDYVMPLVVALPFASGLLVMHPTWSPIPYDMVLLVHVASANFVMFLIPLTKLSHMVLLPGTQLISELAWHFPPSAGEQVGVALGKANEPV